MREPISIANIDRVIKSLNPAQIRRGDMNIRAFRPQ